ncbi:MAG: arginine--tRNA ligase, partial [Pseudomonadales bacterium]
MKQPLAELIQTALVSLQAEGVLPRECALPSVQVDNTRDKSHGDLASNVAMVLAKPAGKSPRDLAAAIVAALPKNTLITKAEIAGPGFINFFLASDAQTAVVARILTEQADFGRSNTGAARKVQVEFVS